MGNKAYAGKAGLTLEGTWDEGRVYERLTGVHYNNCLFISRTQPPVGVPPVEGEYWMIAVRGVTDEEWAKLFDGTTPVGDSDKLGGKSAEEWENNINGVGQSVNALSKTLSNEVSALENAIASTQNAATTAVNSLSTEVDNDIAALRSDFAVIDTHRTDIPKSANLNSYVTVGCFRCTTNANASSYSNCPTTKAFIMDVVSARGYDSTVTTSSGFIVQKILDTTGKEYLREVYASSSTILFGEWKTPVLESKLEAMIKSLIESEAIDVGEKAYTPSSNLLATVLSSEKKTPTPSTQNKMTLVGRWVPEHSGQVKVIGTLKVVATSATSAATVYLYGFTAATIEAEDNEGGDGLSIIEACENVAVGTTISISVGFVKDYSLIGRTNASDAYSSHTGAILVQKGVPVYFCLAPDFSGSSSGNVYTTAATNSIKIYADEV